MNVALNIIVEVVNPELLVNYTSGFMDEDATLGARVAAIVSGPNSHPRLPEINGVKIIFTAFIESDNASFPESP